MRWTKSLLAWLILSYLFLGSSYAQNLSYIPFNGKSLGQNSAGSYAQASWLMGDYQLELILGEAYGRPVIGHRFHWSWRENFQYFGLIGGAMSREELQKYPDLYARFSELKPIYIKFSLELSHFNDRHAPDTTYGESIVEVELFNEQINSAEKRAHNPEHYENFYFRSPEWENFTTLSIANIDTQDLRYIGLKKNNSGSLSDVLHRNQAELNFSYLREVKVRSVKRMEIRWPDKEMQQIFQEFSAREYQAFKHKTSPLTREALALQLSTDANTPLFWNGVNIKLKEYQTKESGQARRIIRTLSDAKERFNSEREKYALMAKRAKYTSAEDLDAAIIGTFKNNASLRPLVNYPHQEQVTTHNRSIQGSILAYRSELKGMNLYINDVIKLGVLRSGDSFDTTLIYNYGMNEIKFGLKYKDGMELIQRFYTDRSGDRTPLRATLFWQFDEIRYGKSDVDIGISPNSSCKVDELLAYHKNKLFKEKGVQIELDVDDEDGFGPENLSIYDQAGQRYYYFCIKNHTHKVPAVAKVVIFENEVITPVSQNSDYIYEVKFDSSPKRRWKAVPGLYKVESY